MYETGGVITGMDSTNERRRHIFKSSRIGWNKTQNDFCEAISNKTKDTFGQVQRPLSNIILSTSTVLVSAEITTNQMLTLKISPYVNDNGKDSGLTQWEAVKNRVGTWVSRGLFFQLFMTVSLSIV